MQAVTQRETAARRAVLWSPSLFGHRIVYCAVMAGVLAELGFDVTVAADVGAAQQSDARRLEKLRRPPVGELYDVAGEVRAEPASLAPLWRLTERLDANLAVVAEADHYLESLRTIYPPRRPGVVLAVFLYETNNQYAARASGAWRLVRRLRHPSASAGTAGEFERLVRLPPPGVVPLVLDELYASRHTADCRWLPDIFRDPDDAASAVAREAAAWGEKVRRFVAAAGQRPLLVYVGTNQHRRGYDTLLRLAVEEEGCVAHCGRFVVGGESSDHEVARLRAALLEDGRLLETKGSYLDPATADVFLTAARCVVLPYRWHDGSSGVMLQAAAAGRPVLVPNRGLMDFRVRRFGLGATYRHEDFHDLRRRFRELQEAGPAPFSANLAAYIDYFSRSQLVAALTGALTGTGEGAQLPQPAAHAAHERGV